MWKCEHRSVWLEENLNLSSVEGGFLSRRNLRNRKAKPKVTSEFWNTESAKNYKIRIREYETIDF